MTPDNLTLDQKRLGGQRGMATQVARGLQSWRKQRWCLPGCICRADCPAVPDSMGLPADKKGRHPCYVKKFGEIKRRWFQRIFIDGREGIPRLQREMMFRMMDAMGANMTMEDIGMAITFLGKLQRDLYPTELLGTQVNIQANITSITLQQVQSWKREDVDALMARLVEAGYLRAHCMPVCRGCLFDEGEVIEAEAKPL